jgi:hypothetical protein
MGGHTLVDYFWLAVLLSGVAFFFFAAFSSKMKLPSNYNGDYYPNRSMREILEQIERAQREVK